MIVKQEFGLTTKNLFLTANIWGQRVRTKTFQIKNTSKFKEFLDFWIPKSQIFTTDTKSFLPGSCKGFFTPCFNPCFRFFFKYKGWLIKKLCDMLSKISNRNKSIKIIFYQLQSHTQYLRNQNNMYVVCMVWI